MAAYSFDTVTATISGAAGTVNIGAGAGVAPDGITVTPRTDKVTTTIGSDGVPMHGAVVDSSADVTVRLLGTSRTNALLQNLLNAQNAQNAEAGVFGEYTITIRDSRRGDLVVLTDCVFQKQPELTWGMEARTVEWMFTAGTSTFTQGSGTTVRF